MKERRSLHYQRGASFLLLVSIIFGISAAIVLLQAVALSRQRANDLPRLQLERVNIAADLMRNYYINNAAVWDKVPAALGSQLETNLLTLANVPSQWNLTVRVSDLLSGSATITPLEGGTPVPQIEYREVVILAPVDNGQTENFVYNSGALTLCPQSTANCPPRANTRIDGAKIESELYSRSLKILNDLAISAQAYFNAKYLSDPDHDTLKNWYRDPYQVGCNNVAVTDMPCIAGWLDTSNASTAAAALALILQPDTDPTELATCLSGTSAVCLANDAWGNRIAFANGNDSSGTEPFGSTYNPTSPASVPYRLGLRATTPWGTPIEILAVQQL